MLYTAFIWIKNEIEKKQKKKCNLIDKIKINLQHWCPFNS